MLSSLKSYGNPFTKMVVQSDGIFSSIYLASFGSNDDYFYPYASLISKYLSFNFYLSNSNALLKLSSLSNVI
jgi:hypothetical protein